VSQIFYHLAEQNVNKINNRMGKGTRWSRWQWYSPWTGSSLGCLHPTICQFPVVKQRKKSNINSITIIYISLKIAIIWKPEMRQQRVKRGSTVLSNNQLKKRGIGKWWGTTAKEMHHKFSCCSRDFPLCFTGEWRAMDIQYEKKAKPKTAATFNWSSSNWSCLQVVHR